MSKEEEAKLIHCFEAIGLKKANLKGKKILDVGAGYADFARVMRNYGVSQKVVSVDNHCDSELLSEPSFRLAEAQFMPFDDDEFDLVVSMNSIPFIGVFGLSAYGRLVKVDEQEEGTSLAVSKSDLHAFERKKLFLRAQAVRECIRVVKPDHEVRLVGGHQENLAGVLEAVEEGITEIAELVQTETFRHNVRFVIKKHA